MTDSYSVMLMSQHNMPQEVSLLDRCSCYGVLSVLPVIMSNKLSVVNELAQSQRSVGEVFKNVQVSKHVQTLLQCSGVSGKSFLKIVLRASLFPPPVLCQAIIHFKPGRLSQLPAKLGALWRCFLVRDLFIHLCIESV